MKNDLYNILKTTDSPLGTYRYYSLPELQKQGYNIDKLPFSIRILLENALRNYDGFSVTGEHIQALLNGSEQSIPQEISFKPARVLMQDFTGVPSVVDLASMRSETERKKGKEKASQINPKIPVDLIIDHSVQVDFYGTPDAGEKNVAKEYERNQERYTLLKWAQQAFKNFRVLPPGLGICHQVNLEYLARGVCLRNGIAFPDTLVGTDSHTPMVNGIGVIGWGVGGIEAEAAMLGQPLYMLNPEVVGLRLTGTLPEGTTATDLVLAVTQLLRKHGVVGKFVEVLGEGLDTLTVPDRATLSNMSPEFGCTVTYFPIDSRTLDYMRLTGRDEKQIETVEHYTRLNMLWRENEDKIIYSEEFELNLESIEPAISGPKRPQDRILISQVKPTLEALLKKEYQTEPLPEVPKEGFSSESRHPRNDNPGNDAALNRSDIEEREKNGHLRDGSVVLAAITSCTNTSNPSVMLGAGLLAKKAVEYGLMVRPWVKTSLAPGSKVVTEYYQKSNLLPYLEKLGFHVVGYGCTTCIGNSGELPEKIAKEIDEKRIVAASVLSGNRNFEARIHPAIKMNFLASPMLVVAYALAGRMNIDLLNEPLGYDKEKTPVFLKDLWPSSLEIDEVMQKVISPDDFKNNYSSLFEGDETWKSLPSPEGEAYQWDENSTYIKEVPFFQDLWDQSSRSVDIRGARVLLLLGDSITTDHISPAGNIGRDTSAGRYLIGKGVEPEDFNSYGSRRGNHEVMIRGTFANVRIKNELTNKEGGWTIYHPDGKIMPVYDAAMHYAKTKTPLIVIGGKDYGSGSSRDWAAKGTRLLGVKAVIAESFERIHRSNLAGMGVLPLIFMPGENRKKLGLTGCESYSIKGLNESLAPNMEVEAAATNEKGDKIEFKATVALQSEVEIAYFQSGGILTYMLKKNLK